MPDTAIGYIRVSTEDQANNGYGLAAQERGVYDYRDRTGVTLLRLERDEAKSAKSTEGRDGLERAIADCRSGLANQIVVARVDRAFRSASDFFAMYEEGLRGGWTLVPLDLPGVDMTSPQGGMILGIMAVFAQYERQVTSERTKAALHELKANGKHIGRPFSYSTHVRKLARQCWYDGYTVDQTVAILNAMVTDPPSRRTVARMMRDERVPVMSPIGGRA